MQAKGCIIYGCMRTKDVTELEGSGISYCGRHLPTDKHISAKVSAPINGTFSGVKKANKAKP